MYLMSERQVISFMIKLKQFPKNTLILLFIKSCYYCLIKIFILIKKCGEIVLCFPLEMIFAVIPCQTLSDLLPRGK